MDGIEAAGDILSYRARYGAAEIGGLLRRNLQLLAAVVATGLCLTFLVVQTMTPEYTARTMMVLEPGGTLMDPRTSRLRSQALSPAQIMTEMDLIRSRDFATLVVERLGLAADLDATSRAGDAVATATPAGKIDAATSELLEMYSVSLHGQSLALEVRVVDSDPDRAARIANGIAGTYIDRSQETQLAELDWSAGIMEERVGELAEALETAEASAVAFDRENELDTYKLKERLLSRMQQATERLGAARRSDASALEIAELEDEVSEADARLRSATAAELQSLTLERQLAMMRDRHDLFTEQLNDLYVQRDLIRANARQLGQAVVPDEPTAPRKMTALAGAFVGSVAIAIVAMLLRESLDRRLRDGEEAEAISGLAELGRIPRIPRRDAASAEALDLLLSDRGPAAREAEAMRALLTALVAPVSGRACTSICIASAAPREGRSLLALALALSAAQEGNDVLLVDLDTRLESDGLLGASRSAAGFEALSLDAQAAESAIETIGPAGGPDLLRPAALPGVPLLLSRGRTGSSGLEALRARYDLILFDTPPLLGSAVATRVALIADRTVLVAREGRTEDADLLRARDLLKLGGTPAFGLVFNDG